jgi:hypothetical protein
LEACGEARIVTLGRTVKDEKTLSSLAQERLEVGVDGAIEVLEKLARPVIEKWGHVSHEDSANFLFAVDPEERVENSGPGHGACAAAILDGAAIMANPSPNLSSEPGRVAPSLAN